MILVQFTVGLNVDLDFLFELGVSYFFVSDIIACRELNILEYSWENGVSGDVDLNILSLYTISRELCRYIDA